MELYIHIPFCTSKCRYCSFVSFANKEKDIEEYTALILKEARQRIEEQCEPIRTVYIGGGTPSLIPEPVFRHLLKGLYEIYELDNVEEFTCEVNPGTTEHDWLICAADYGVNRLSVGMQAYQDEMLKYLGRHHRYCDVKKTVQMAKQTGIQNINLDLIFGIPNQNMCQWNETLERALQLFPYHISAYGLIPEEGTPLNNDLLSGAVSLPEPELEREMYDAAIDRLGQYGMMQYEISNFAIQGYECIHNIGYWSHIPYIGLGVSAASMTDINVSGQGMSCVRKKNPDSYQAYQRMIIEKQSAAETEIITPADTRFESMMLGLRMNKGVSDELFFHKHGLTVSECFGDKLTKMIDEGLLLHENGYWKMTRKGFDIQNTILVELL